MKKLISVLIICLIVIAVAFAFAKVPSLNEKLNSVLGGFSSEKIEEYNEGFEVNRLKIKSQMFYYNTLNETQKYIYAAIANAVRDLNNTVNLNEYKYNSTDETVKDIDVAMQAFFADHPEVFYVESKYTVSTTTVFFRNVVEINLEYNVASKEELEQKLVALEEKINEYLNLAKSENIFDIELVLHDLVAKKVQYHEYDNLNDVPQESHNIYGTLINNRAVCDGFTKTMQILLDRKGIESIIVMGTLDNEAHAWNLVKLDDSWYHLDVTSDKSIKELRNGEQVVVHSYFNITTDKIKSGHIIENEQILPVANNKKYEYYTYTGKIITSNDNFSNKLSTLLTNNTDYDLLEFDIVGIDDVADKIVDTLSKNRYNEYINNDKINYYTIMSSYVIMKK